MTFRFLGTGTSVGVPQIGCGCRVCTSPDPRDKRRRAGAYVVASDGAALLIDTPPELRLACLECSVSKVDAVALTHAHMDHIAGFDDVRRFNTINGVRVECDPNSPGANGRTFRIVGKPLPCYAIPETTEAMHRIFPYIGTEGGEMGLFRPQVFFSDATKPFQVGSLRVESFRVEHGFPCCGYLLSEESSNGVRRLGYASDCHDLPDESVERLRGVDVMVIDCLREREHPTHLSLKRALEYLARIAPGKAYLTHMCHDLTHEEWLERLPPRVEPAYDGLEIQL
jgi:phosphoribosyl 1,2-cyclic phosphate phosphodiesterase